MMRSFSYLLGTLWVTTALSYAQTQPPIDVPPPQAPYVAAVPNTAQWTVTLKYGKETGEDAAKPATAKTSPADRIQQLSVTKIGTQKRDILTNTSGSKVETWYIDTLTIYADSDGSNVMIARVNLNDPHFGERGNPLESTGFTGVSWISEKYYDKPVRFQKEVCYHYVLKTATAPVVVENDPSAIQQTGGAEAWISVKTNLPVAYRFDDVLYTYAFDFSSSPTLKMPPSYQAKYDLYKRLIGQ